MAAQKLKLFFDDAIPDYDEVPDEIENNVSSKYVSVATLPYPKERKHKPNPDATYAVVDKTPKVSYIDGKLGLNYACMVRFCFHESLSYFAPRCLRDLCHEMFFLTNLYLAIHYYPLHFYNPLTLQMISNDKTAHKYNRKPWKVLTFKYLGVQCRVSPYVEFRGQFGGISNSKGLWHPLKWSPLSATASPFLAFHILAHANRRSVCKVYEEEKKKVENVGIFSSAWFRSSLSFTRKKTVRIKILQIKKSKCVTVALLKQFWRPHFRLPQKGQIWTLNHTSLSPQGSSRNFCPKFSKN